MTGWGGGGGGGAGSQEIVQCSQGNINKRHKCCSPFNRSYPSLGNLSLLPLGNLQIDPFSAILDRGYLEADCWLP